MSVLIKGMKMPEDGVYWCEIGVAGEIATITIHGEDHKSFHLVPIPPHGRLKDFDAFNDEATKLLDKFYENGEYAEERGVNMLRHIAFEAPTILEAEEGEKE